MREYLEQLRAEQQAREERREKMLYMPLCIVSTMLFCVIAFLVWWAAPALADEIEDPEELTEMFVICQPDSFVNIRARASKHAYLEGRLYLGDSVFVDAWHGSWAHCVNLGCEAGEGWVNVGYLAEMEPDVLVEAVQMRTTKANVNTRYCIGGKRRSCLRKRGTVVTVCAISDEWAVTNVGLIQANLLADVTE